MIDKKQFKENFDFFDKEVVLEIIDLFIKEYPERLQTIEQSIYDNDFDSIKFNSHSIKGVVANFVDEETKDLAKNLEFKGRDKDNSGIQELFRKFKISCDQLIEDLKELRENYL